MTAYNLCFWLWVATGATIIFMLWAERTESHKLKLWAMTLTQLNRHHRTVGFIYGAALVLAILSFAGLYIFTPEPIISYVPSLQP